MTLIATRTPKRRQATTRTESEAPSFSSTSLEQVLRALVALAAGPGEPPRKGGQSGDFERWEDDESSYIEATLSDLKLPEIDLNSHEGRVVIRITWPSKEDDEGEGGVNGDGSAG
jgi:hypothetical protein